MADILAQQTTSTLTSLMSSGGINASGVFIPGDIANRQAQTAQWTAQAGLLPTDLNQTTVNAILDVQSGWQANIQTYIAKVAGMKAQGIATANQQFTFTPNNGLTPYSGVTTPVSQSSLTMIPQTTSLLSNPIVLILGGLILYKLMVKK